MEEEKKIMERETSTVSTQDDEGATDGKPINF